MCACKKEAFVSVHILFPAVAAARRWGPSSPGSWASGSVCRLLLYLFLSRLLARVSARALAAARLALALGRQLSCVQFCCCRRKSKRKRKRRRDVQSRPALPSSTPRRPSSLVPRCCGASWLTNPSSVDAGRDASCAPPRAVAAARAFQQTTEICNSHPLPPTSLGLTHAYPILSHGLQRRGS